MDMRKLVGQNVRRIREGKGLTQEQFSELSGFSQQYISGLEQGRRVGEAGGGQIRARRPGAREVVEPSGGERRAPEAAGHPDAAIAEERRGVVLALLPGAHVAGRRPQIRRGVVELGALQLAGAGSGSVPGGGPVEQGLGTRE